MGRRPTLPERKNRLAPLSVSDAELEAIHSAASARGITVAQFLREAAMAYATEKGKK